MSYEVARTVDTSSEQVLQELLGRLIHEVRSPLSVVLLSGGDSPGDPVVMGARRIEQLLRYATVVLRQSEVKLAAVPAREAIEEAAGRLAETGAFTGVLLAHELETEERVLLPADEELRAALLEGWLEAASYGVSSAALSVRRWRGASDLMGLEALSGGELRRRVDLVGRRLGPRVAAILARRCGGRLVLSAKRPAAKLMLSPAPAAREV